MIDYLAKLHQTRRFLFAALWLVILFVVIYGPLKVSDLALTYAAIDIDDHRNLYIQLKEMWLLVAVFGLLFVVTKIQERAKH